MLDDNARKDRESVVANIGRFAVSNVAFAATQELSIPLLRMGGGGSGWYPLFPWSVRKKDFTAEKYAKMFIEGKGPLYKGTGWLAKKFPILDKIGKQLNEAFVGEEFLSPSPDLDNIISNQYGQYLQHQKDAKKMVIESIVKNRADKSNKILRKSKILDDIYEGAAKGGTLEGKIGAALYRLDKRMMISRQVLKAAFVGHIAMGASLVLDIGQSVLSAGANYGRASVEAKASSEKIIVDSPSAEALRMKAFQDASASYGAMRVAIGTEAMGFHRFN